MSSKSTCTIYIQYFISVAQNLAASKPAYQSSRYSATEGAAGNAVDGNASGAWPDGSCTHTNNNANEWWAVDLGSTNSVTTVKITNREDCCGEILTTFDPITFHSNCLHLKVRSNNQL